MREITASPEKYPFCPSHISAEELIGCDSQFGTIYQTAPWRVEFCSRHVALPAKMNLHDFGFCRMRTQEARRIRSFGNSYATARGYSDRTNGCHIPDARW